MKLMIAGSRGIRDFDFSEYISPITDLIITGGAKGIDTLAEKYADSHGLSKIVLRPQYARYGKSAPLKRNAKMVEIADQVLVIWDGKSKGCKYTIDYAKKQQKDIRVILTKERKQED